MAQAAVRGTSVERDTSGTHLWLVLSRAFRALEKHAYASIDTSDIGLSDFGTLELLLHKGPLPVNEIGRRIGLTSGSVTTAVDRLEERGLVSRAADRSDRRTKIVHLTSKGRALIERLFQKHKAVMDQTAHALTSSERGTLIDLLKKLGFSASA